MTLVAIGINHRSATVTLREKVAFGPDVLAEALRHLGRGIAEEAVILSTCNRTELYCVGDQLTADALVRWLGEFHGLKHEALLPSLYQLHERDVVSHLMRVASGLDSLMLGEPQILGQLKQAYQAARDNGTVSALLDRLFQRCFSVAKQIRTETAIGANAVSVAFASVRLAQRIFASLEKSKVMLIGAGETCELVARHLADQGCSEIIVANRTLGRAEPLARQFGAEVITLQQIPERLHEADIVISSTAAPLPLLGKGAVEQALRQRRHKPMLLIDLAVPRDIEPAVSELDDIYLYTVDDLQSIIDENIRAREQAAEVAEQIVVKQTAEFQAWQRSLSAVSTICDYRSHHEAIRDELLERALGNLRNGADAELVTRQLANQLCNRLMHAPTRALSQAGEQGQQEVLTVARDLFGLQSGS